MLLRGGRFGSPNNNSTVRILAVHEGWVLHGNGARAGRHFAHSAARSGVLSTPGGVPFLVAHQSGKVSGPKGFVALLRRSTTCRLPDSRPQAPQFCTLCSADAAWLGVPGRAWNRSFGVENGWLDRVGHGAGR